MKVLLSIKPKYAEAILNGTKLYEYRKYYFKKPAYFNQTKKTVLLYATKPVGRIVGEFTINYTLNGSRRSIWGLTSRGPGISKKEFYAYYGDSKTAYAMRVLGPIRYEKPLTLEEIGVKRAPQSFCYID